MSTEEIIIFASLVAFAVLCVLAFLTWTVSLVCICTQNSVSPSKAVREEHYTDGKSLAVGSVVVDSEENCFDDRPSLFTPTTNYEGYLSIHTAWSQGRSSIE